LTASTRAYRGKLCDTVSPYFITRHFLGMFRSTITRDFFVGVFVLASRGTSELDSLNQGVLWQAVRHSFAISHHPAFPWHVPQQQNTKIIGGFWFCVLRDHRLNQAVSHHVVRHSCVISSPGILQHVPKHNNTQFFFTKREFFFFFFLQNTEYFNYFL
jgi:hypothetical protein